MDGRLGTPCGIQATRTERGVALINVVHVDAAHRPEDPVPGVARKLNVRALHGESDDAVGKLECRSAATAEGHCTSPQA